MFLGRDKTTPDFLWETNRFIKELEGLLRETREQLGGKGKIGLPERLKAFVDQIDETELQTTLTRLNTHLNAIASSATASQKQLLDEGMSDLHPLIRSAQKLKKDVEIATKNIEEFRFTATDFLSKLRDAADDGAQGRWLGTISTLGTANQRLEDIQKQTETFKKVFAVEAIIARMKKDYHIPVHKTVNSYIWTYA
jgi:hypothetical protein